MVPQDGFLFDDTIGENARFGRPDATDDRPDAAKGYLAMKAQGMTHQDIVDKIARDVIAVLDAKRGAGSDRHNDKKGSF